MHLSMLISLIRLQYSVFNETLRHFPPVPYIPKSSADDILLTLTNEVGKTRSLPVPRGTYIAICTSSLHNNRILNSICRAPLS